MSNEKGSHHHQNDDSIDPHRTTETASPPSHHDTNTTRASSSTNNETSKPHPSEFLEFATVPGAIPGKRLEPLKVGPSIEFQADSGVSNPTHSNDALYDGLSRAIPNLRRLSIEARAATRAEHRMGFFSGCRLYPKAILWSAMLSLTIIMEGYDLTLINSFFAFPTFRRAYGGLHTPAGPNTSGSATGNNQPTYQISPAWQSGLTNAAVTGEILGLMLNGYLTDRFGYHKTMVFTLIWMSLFVFLAFFAVNIEMLLAAQVLCGLPWGIFQTLSTTVS